MTFCRAIHHGTARHTHHRSVRGRGPQRFEVRNQRPNNYRALKVRTPSPATFATFVEVNPACELVRVQLCRRATRWTLSIVRHHQRRAARSLFQKPLKEWPPLKSISGGHPVFPPAWVCHARRMLVRYPCQEQRCNATTAQKRNQSAPEAFLQSKVHGECCDAQLTHSRLKTLPNVTPTHEEQFVCTSGHCAHPSMSV